MASARSPGTVAWGITTIAVPCCMASAVDSDSPEEEDTMGTSVTETTEDLSASDPGLAAPVGLAGWRRHGGPPLSTHAALGSVTVADMVSMASFTEQEDSDDYDADTAHTRQSRVTKQPTAVDIAVMSEEWAYMSSTSRTSSLPGVRTRHQRYRHMAEEGHEYNNNDNECHDGSDAADGEETPMPSPHRLRVNAAKLAGMHAVVGFVLFLAANMKLLTCVLLGHALVLRTGHVSYLVLLVLEVFFLFFQTACVLRDRRLLVRRNRYWTSGMYIRWFCHIVFTIVGLGIFSGWQVLRSIRQIKDVRYRDSFLVELSEGGMFTDSAQQMPRYSSHLCFLFDAPFVARLTRTFVWHGRKMFIDERPDAFDWLVSSSWVLVFHVVIISVLSFDHAVSQYIKDRYVTDHLCSFPLLHYVYRVCEVSNRFIFLAAAIEINKAYWGAGFVLLFMDYWTVFIAITKASGGISKRGWFMTIPLWSADLGLYVDQEGLRSSARALTCILDWTRFIESLIAALILFHRGQRSSLSALIGFWIVAFTTSVCVALRCLLVAPPRADDDGDGELAWGGLMRLEPSEKMHESLWGRAMDDRYTIRNDGLAEHLFSKGIGDQFASLLEICCEYGHLQLSRLVAIKKLGEGGFGRVFQVRDTRNGAEYALKLQRRDTRSDCAVREAQALQRSPHVFIVQLVRIFRTSQLYGILLELCDQDLNKCILGCKGPTGIVEGLPHEQVQHYLACMLLALEHLHRRNIVFRDLKPENVLTVTAESAGPARSHAKLADFGMATSVHNFVAPEMSLGSRSTRSSKNRMTAKAGTLAFMPVEVIDDEEGEEELRDMRWYAARDWYGLGCCLLLMLLGERGGRKVHQSRRQVLLPPSQAEILSSCQQALAESTLSLEAFGLVTGLTEQRARSRANSLRLRGSPFLSAAIEELEDFPPQ
uniref:Protein kinase domain-containing protein n=1 Tax=Zooxanthella nutricula TaxID=1333877 RepID=A0A7S2PU46_9DINO